ncbi:hypothetical protein DM860_011880 [Cuscuta australis]|uniref:Pectinesterase inhibitor domain-containing protein n=1 Tax=Cuscuta australis TaxID=267555 RepID=A0A328D8F5_9ASTE|nr:hypothetical protein DM860_011880 [Cuscuta australis]
MAVPRLLSRLPLPIFSLAFALLLRLSDATAQVDPALISRACEYAKGGTTCVAWLQDNEDDAELSGIDRSDPDSIAFFSLKKIEKEAVMVSEAVSAKLSAGTAEDLSPVTQQGLAECKDHYVPAVDLIEEAVDSLAGKAYPDAMKFLKASTLDLVACQKSLAKLGTDKKDTKADAHATDAINRRDLLASHVALAQSILEFSASGGGAAASVAAPPS